VRLDLVPSSSWNLEPGRNRVMWNCRGKLPDRLTEVTHLQKLIRYMLSVDLARQVVGVCLTWEVGETWKKSIASRVPNIPKRFVGNFDYPFRKCEQTSSQPWRTGPEMQRSRPQWQRSPDNTRFFALFRTIAFWLQPHHPPSRRMEAFRAATKVTHAQYGTINHPANRETRKN
jgi:hypothetical protein